MKRRCSATCDMMCTYDEISISFEGPDGIRAILQSTLANLSKTRSLDILPPDRSDRKWFFQFTTSHAADVVADSLLGIFHDGFELNRDCDSRFFDFWSLAEKAKTASEGRHP